MDNIKLIPKEIKELIDLIKEIDDDKLCNEAQTILNRRRDLLFSFHVDAADCWLCKFMTTRGCRLLKNNKL